MTRNHWDERFSEEEYVYGTEPNEFIRTMSRLIPPHSKVAALAEGEGRNAVYLAEAGHSVTAFDQSTVGLQKAVGLAEKRGVQIETKEADLIKDRIPADSFDAAILVFGHVPKESQESFFFNLIGSVKNGGIILFEVYSEEQLRYGTGGPGNLESLYDPADILRWIRPHDVVHFYYGEADRSEGSRHTGTGHVIQGAIRKK
ncbi:class I SAM-dependent methyltransferase [Bhargavaea cecembensis]|uniref:class I SAM-dependent methyltransferase n=1 Tax=Bhargavaea cecembensis TaxID=394098 RepID=UPI000590A4F4|nr:class I SAM-dependent methyltransferase [Bhargavaea cecembensis]